MKVTGTLVLPAQDGGITYFCREYTKPEGLECEEKKFFTCESDYYNKSWVRRSPDNGRTWSEWRELERTDFTQKYGDDEYIRMDTKKTWNPVWGHYVSSYFTRYYINGYRDASVREYNNGEHVVFDHQYLAVIPRDADEPVSDEMVKYENGKDFDPDYPRDMDFLDKNIGFLNAASVMKCGDILLPVSPTVRTGCALAGLDAERVFPSSPDIQRCVMIARGRFNEKRKAYDLEFSNPVILGDLLSSRGVCEPIAAELESGRILLVMRGSNVRSKGWKTRIEPGAPGFKWYSYSDDGGKTFTEPAPWHFDDREVIYSSATIGEFIRSAKTGRLYWVGNITDHSAYGNYPRHPLNIVEVDENTGLAKKESLTVIDTRRDGEPDTVQLSNFCLLEDRETKNFEITLAKFGQFEGTFSKKVFRGEAWKYTVEPE